MHACIDSIGLKCQNTQEGFLYEVIDTMQKFLKDTHHREAYTSQNSYFFYNY